MKLLFFFPFHFDWMEEVGMFASLFLGYEGRLVDIEPGLLGMYLSVISYAQGCFLQLGDVQ